MPRIMTDAEVKAAYADFLADKDSVGGDRWRRRYAEQIERVRQASADEWMQPAFQREVWGPNDVIGIGPGSSVTVDGAYADADFARYLLKLRDEGLPEDPAEAAVKLQAIYEQILAAVWPRYSERRPRARILRLLAMLFPRHMTCLMDWNRTFQVRDLIGADRAATDFVGQNPMIRDRLRQILGDQPGSDADHSTFCWRLWETNLVTREDGAVEVIGVGRLPQAVPEFSILPVGSQRRSLFGVQNNLALLAMVVRECEQGISKPDLVSLIRSEAPQLSEASATAVITQQALGGGFGLISFSQGAYSPTARGVEFLNAPVPGSVLRGPLIGRLFGMGQLLLYLLREGEASQQDAVRYVQSLVPSWKTSMAASYVVQWARLVGLVRAEVRDGKTQLSLTEDGEDYAAALPADFDVRWAIPAEATEIADVGDDLSGALLDAKVTDQRQWRSYGLPDIVADGCFLPPAELDELLDLLRRKKNLVLQGPPGTGKTWLARRLGYALLGEEDKDRVWAVQFQPSLSYEDFVRGWRPYALEDGEGRLRLVDGVFLQCVAKARLQPNRDFVLVIEEINRGNPAQVLGELLTLLEADKRQEREAVRLAYARSEDERVFIPPNLYVIGTMNLADRSLALVDLALRRRFAFKTLEPALNGEWGAWCAAAGAPPELVEAIRGRMEELNSAIAADKRLRSQFCIGHSFVTPPREGFGNGLEGWKTWLRSVVETEIAPLLDEYWYDDEATASSHKAKLARPW